MKCFSSRSSISPENSDISSIYWTCSASVRDHPYLYISREQWHFLYSLDMQLRSSPERTVTFPLSTGHAVLRLTSHLCSATVTFPVCWTCSASVGDHLQRRMTFPVSTGHEVIQLEIISRENSDISCLLYMQCFSLISSHACGAFVFWTCSASVWRSSPENSDIFSVDWTWSTSFGDNLQKEQWYFLCPLDMQCFSLISHACSATVVWRLSPENSDISAVYWTCSTSVGDHLQRERWHSLPTDCPNRCTARGCDHWGWSLISCIL